MRPVREFGFLSQPVKLDTLGFSPADLKAHVSYHAAKSGDAGAAFDLIDDFARRYEALGPLIPRYPPASIVVAPHAVEAGGDNAIPEVFASMMTAACDARRDREIVQRNKVFHTGADPMQRLISRPQFTGAVERGEAYILVDDVTTMGGTLADLADYLRAHGATVAGAVVLASASRTGRLVPAKADIRILRTRFGDAIRDILGIETEALTADEARYLVGFRDADELRNRAAKAKEERDRRLRARGHAGPRAPDA